MLGVMTQKKDCIITRTFLVEAKNAELVTWKTKYWPSGAMVAQLTVNQEVIGSNPI